MDPLGFPLLHRQHGETRRNRVAVGIYLPACFCFGPQPNKMGLELTAGGDMHVSRMNRRSPISRYLCLRLSYLQLVSVMVDCVRDSCLMTDNDEPENRVSSFETYEENDAFDGL